MVWPETGATNYHAQLGHSGKGRVNQSIGYLQ